MKKESQLNKIFRYLSTGRTLTQLGALRMFGCFRLASRINELRNEGYKIDTNRVKQKSKIYASYTLHF